MKTLRTTLAALMIMVSAIVANAQPMSVYSIRSNARFLTDRMAYTLKLNPALIDDLYYINYDYICGVNDYLDDVALGYRYDDYMEIIYARDYALRRLLTERQWALLMTYDYFYRPITFADRRWSFAIYRHDHRMDHFFFGTPRRYTEYRGGNFFGGMRPAPVRPGAPGHMPPVMSGRVDNVHPNIHPSTNVNVVRPNTNVNVVRPNTNVNVVRPNTNVNVARPNNNVNVARPNNNVNVTRPNNNVNVTRPNNNVNVARPNTNVNVARPNTNVNVARPNTNVNVARPNTNIRTSAATNSMNRQATTPTRSTGNMQNGPATTPRANTGNTRPGGVVSVGRR